MIDTVDQLNTVTRDDIADLDELEAAERRKLWKFVSERQTPKGPAPEPEKKKKSSKTKGAKAGKAGSKSAKGCSSTTVADSAKWEFQAAVGFMFRSELPDGAFFHMTTFLF